MQLNIVHYTLVDKNKWDDFVITSSMDWAYFLYDVIKFPWFKTGKNDSFAIIDENENIYMVVDLYKTSDNNLLSRWGFAIKNDLTKKQAKSLKRAFEDYIDSYIIYHNIKNFDINLPPLTNDNRPEKHNCINPLIYYNFSPGIRYTFLVDLSKPEERMLADCEETTRQAIRKYDKLGKYSIIESNGTKNDYYEYAKLLKETFKRTGASKDCLYEEYNANIFKNLIPKGICKVFFLKDNETEEYVADVAILIFNNTAYYWWGSSKTEKDVGINKYLLFKVICIIKKMFNNSGFFETGAGHLHVRSGPAKGLTDYKKCFGVFLHPIFTGSYSKIPVPHKTLNIMGIKIKYKDKNKNTKIKIRFKN